MLLIPRHLLTYIDDPDYRRDIIGIRNLQEGMEEQLGALGLVLNCVTLWNTAYMDVALTQLRTTGYPSWTTTSRACHPFPRKHNVHGTYTFTLAALAGGMRTLRAHDTPDEDD